MRNSSRSKIAVRDSVRRALDNAPNATSYLTYSGILPVDLPEGTSGVITPDLHYPAHNQPLWWGYLNFLADFKPDIFVSIGDWNDILSLTRHPKALRTVSNPQDELDGGKRTWDDAMEYSGAVHGYLTLGNHEDRIYRYFQEFCPALGSMVTQNNREAFNFHNLMGFRSSDNATLLYGREERGGFEGGLVFNSDLNLHHGTFVRPTPGASPLADMNKWLWSVGHGHTHRMGMCSTGLLRCYEFGHMVNPEHAYLAYAKDMFINWAPGFAVFFVHNGRVHVQPVPVQAIPDSKGVLRLGFVWGGKVYFESDR